MVFEYSLLLLLLIWLCLRHVRREQATRWCAAAIWKLHFILLELQQRQMMLLAMHVAQVERRAQHSS